MQQGISSYQLKRGGGSRQISVKRDSVFQAVTNSDKGGGGGGGGRKKQGREKKGQVQHYVSRFHDQPVRGSEQRGRDQRVETADRRRVGVRQKKLEKKIVQCSAVPCERLRNKIEIAVQTEKAECRGLGWD